MKQDPQTGSSHPRGVEIAREKPRLHLVLNACWEPLEFELPPAGNPGISPWRRCIDTP